MTTKRTYTQKAKVAWKWFYIFLAIWLVGLFLFSQSCISISSGGPPHCDAFLYNNGFKGILDFLIGPTLIITALGTHLLAIAFLTASYFQIRKVFDKNN